MSEVLLVLVLVNILFQFVILFELRDMEERL